MTLRRYAPLALSALALACQPDIDQRTNATTVEYAVFNPSASQIPLPNDIALSKVAAYLPGGAAAALPCNMTPPPPATPDAQSQALCAFARAGGFPAPATLASIQIQFMTGTLGGDGTVAYAPSPLDTDSFTFAALGAANTPNVAVVDGTLFQQWGAALISNPATPPPAGLIIPVTVFAYAGGTLTLSPVAGSWPAGHLVVALVRGYADGILTDTGATYAAMPPLYILREAVLGNLDLRLPENQGLLPGDAAAKATAGEQLEPLRLGYESLEQMTQILALAGVVMPFGELVSMQTFQVAPGGTLTLGDGTDPTDFSVTGVTTSMFDAFTLESSLSSATVLSVTFNLAEGSAALTNLFVSGASDCSVPLGAAVPVTAEGPVTLPLTNWLDVDNTETLPLYVCATTKAVLTQTNVTGAVTTVTAFPGTGFTVTGTDSSAQLTVNP